ncbi:MAG: hypothetical protein Q9195_009340 [Heterodermia aff. obscurata]
MAIIEDLFDSFKPAITAVCVFVLIYVALIHPIFFAPLAHVPGPIGCKLSWYYIALFDVKLTRNDRIAEWHKKYGPVICIRPGEVSLSDPLLMREIYGTKGKYTKSRFFDHFMAYGARALFSIGPYWEHQQKRMLISTFYHRTSIQKPVVELFVRERMQQFFHQINMLQTKTDTVKMYPIFNCFAFDNITRLLYGPRHCAYTLESDCRERQLLLQMKQAQLWSPVKFNFPIVNGSRIAKRLLGDDFKASLSAEDDLADWNWRNLNEAMEDKEVTIDNSLLARMLAVKDQDGRPLDLNYIGSELFDHLNAAQETVAVALVYVTYHLGIHRDWQAMIREELQALPIQDDGFPALAAIEAAPLFEAFIREVHRVNPGASGRQERYVPEGGKVYNGILLPEGVRLLILLMSSLTIIRYEPQHQQSPSIMTRPFSLLLKSSVRHDGSTYPLLNSNVWNDPLFLSVMAHVCASERLLQPWRSIS